MTKIAESMYLNTKDKTISTWLTIVCLAIVFMIFIGGLTRLTDSGLSITEWKPISGILPPLSEESWVEEFNKYKLSPEYIKINKGMEIDQFKSIFWIEFIHRIAGRITGMIFFLPFLYFFFTKLKRAEIVIYSSASILLIAQGFAGWYMVKSGLMSDPHVSHFRLAMHLLLAIALYTILFWQLLKNFVSTIAIEQTNKLNIWLNISLILLFLQIILGAFVAGLDAGLVYNSFPLMGETVVPHELTLNSITLSSFSDPVFVQFMHRVFGTLLLITVFLSYYAGYKIKNLQLLKVLSYLLIAIIFQVTTGIITLIYMVPITTALIHQIGAVILLSILLWAKYLIKPAKK